MNVEKPSSRLLLIDGDAPLIDAAVARFENEGYHVDTASTGQDGLAKVLDVRPHLILLSARLSDMEGLAVFHRLRNLPRAQHIPVMVLAGRSDVMLQNQMLEAGAYDFIEKPVDFDILVLRVRNALRKAEREGLTETRTGLPTDRLIRERLEALEDQGGWFRMKITIKDFGVFRDLYGFVTANEALRFAGNLIAQIVNDHGNASDFVGHYTGTEDFVVLTQINGGAQLQALLEQRLMQELESFYNFEERDRGYVLIEDGAGGSVQKSLMSAHITVMQGDGAEEDAAAPPDDNDENWIDAAGDNDRAHTDSGDSDDGDSAFDW